MIILEKNNKVVNPISSIISYDSLSVAQKIGLVTLIEGIITHREEFP